MNRLHAGCATRDCTWHQRQDPRITPARSAVARCCRRSWTTGPVVTDPAAST